MPNTSIANTEYLTINEAANLLKVSAKTLRRWEAKGILKPQRTEGGHRRYRYIDVILYKKAKQRGHRVERKPLDLNTNIPSLSSYIENTLLSRQKSLTKKLDIVEANLAQTNKIAEQLLSSSNDLTYSTSNQEKPNTNQRISLNKNSYVLKRFAIFAVFIIFAFAGSVVAKSAIPQVLTASRSALSSVSNTANVLAEKIELKEVVFSVNVPSLFKQTLTVDSDASISGKLSVLSNISVAGQDNTIGGTLNLSGNRLAASGDLSILPTGGGVRIGATGTPTIDLANGDLYVSNEIEAGSSISLNGDKITDFTGTGLTLNSGVLTATLGGSVESSEITNDTILAVDLNVSEDPTDGYALTYDSDSGGFTWTDLNSAITGAGWKDDGTVVRLNTITDDVAIGSTTSIGKLGVTGDTDEVQIAARANATQTESIFTVEQSDGTNIFSIGVSGETTLTDSGSSDIAFNLSSTGDFVIQDNGVTFATFTDNGTFVLDNIRLEGNTISTTTGNLTLSPSASIIFNGFDCTSYTNGGALTADASGVISCSNDDGGGGTSDWTSGSSVVYLQTTTNNVNIGGSSNLGKLAVDGDTDEVQLLVQGNGTQTNFLAVFEQSTGTDVFTISNTGNLVTAGDAAVNGGDITTTSSSATIFNSNATSIDFGEAATAISIGANSGTTTFNHDVVVNGTLTTAASNFAADGASTFSPSGTNDVTMNLDSDSTLILNGVQTGTASNGLCLDSGNNVITCSAASSITLQTAYGNDTNGSDTIISLTSSDDSLVFRNPAASGTDSSYVLQIDQLAGGAVDTLRLTQSGTGVVLDATSSSTGKLLNLTTTGAATTADAIFIEATNAGGVITDAIDASDAEIVNALNVGTNTIAGTTAVVDFTNFDVDASGNVTLNGSADLTIGTIGLNDVGSNNTTSGASLVGVFDEFTNSNSTTVQDVLDDLDAAISSGTYTSWTLAGDTGTNQTISNNDTVSIVGGTNGIDTATSNTDTITLNLDATEIGTTTFGSGSGITWTFDASAGTDTTIAFGNNTQTFTTATATFSGNVTAQGTTGLTLSGTGADLTFANSESITNDTNSQFNFKRNDAGAVTITAEDDDTTAALNILPGGAAALTLGGSSTTAITLTTDSTGDSEVVLPSSSIGNSELVNSSITFAGDSGSSTTSLGGTRTIAGGTNGIDTSESTGTVTLNLDTTEIGTTTFGSGSGITWTFDASAGTDTTIAFGNNTQTFTTATATFSGNVTVQGTTGLTLSGAGADLTIGSIGLNDVGSTNTTSGASLVGVFDEFTNSNSTTVQDVLDDLDAAITSGSYSGWTLSDGSTTQAIDTGNTVTVSDSTTVNATVSATDTITLNVIADSLDFTELSDALALDADTSVTASAGRELTYNKTFTDATSENGMVLNFTASDTSSGTTAQYGLYLDNVASTEGLDASLVIDNSDADDSVAAAIKIINAGGNFTNILDIEGTLLSGTELGRLDGKDAALVDTNDAVTTAITGTGALNSGSITSGFGAIDTGADNITTTGSVLGNAFDRTTGGALTLGATNATSLTLGSSSVTAITLTTDGTGDGEVVLPSNSVGNSELVNSSITFAGDSGSSATSLGGTRTVAGGTNGIDTSESTGTITINLDTTEIGTTSFGSGSAFTWTFDASGGTDTTLAFGNNLATYTGSTFTVASPTANADSLAIVPQSSTATNSFTGTITSDDLTGNRTYTFPNATGTVCLTSGNCAGVGGSISGSGTSGQIAYFDGASSITSEASGFSWDATNNKLGIGTDSPTSKLHVTGAVTGKALAIFDETGDQNILVASASGTTVATIDRTGQLTLNTTTANADKIALVGNATGSNTFTGSLTTADLTANRTYTFPDATGTVCLTSGNCAGVGGIMASFNIAGDSGSDTVTDSQTVTVAGGTNGIDTSESGRTVTINLDATEIGTTTFGSGSGITWTFDASAGTDTSIAFGNNTQTFTTGTATFSGDVTVQGGDITLNTAGTIVPSAAGTITIGNSSLQSLTVTTDSTGDSEVVLPANSIGNSELVNSGITFAGDSGSSSTALGGTRTIAGGTNGIDTSESTGTVTLNLDTTEIGTTTFGSGSGITWTFDASAGTDTTIAFGNDTVNITAGTTTATGALTVTGTTTLNGIANIGDGGDAISLSGTTVGITSNSGSNDITLTSADDILFNPSDDITTTFAAGGQFVIDASTTANTTTGGVLDLNVNAGNAAVIASNIDFVQNNGAAAGTDGIAQQINLTANDADGDVFGSVISSAATANAAAGSYEALLKLTNAEDTIGAVTDALLITTTSATAGDITDAIDTSASDITNAINVGQNFILGDGIRQFSSSSTVWTIEDTAGNDLMTITDAGTTGNVVVSGTSSVNGNVTLGDANTDTLTINAGSSGSGITLADSSFANCTLTTVSGVLTCGSAGGTMSSFIAAGDTGGGQTISNSNTLSILGGTNGIDTVDSATDTVTINLDATEIGTTTFGSGSGITWTFDASAGTDTSIAFGNNTQTFTTGTATFSGDVTVQGGDVTGANSAAIDLGEATTGSITFSAGTTGDYVFGTDADTNFQITQSAAPGVDMLAITDGGNNSTTDNVDGIALTFGVSAASGSLVHLTPSYADGTAGATSETFNIIDIDAFTANQNASGDTGLVRGVNIGNLTQTESAGTITASALRVGTGWDDILSYNGTQIISGTGVLQSTALSGTYSNALTLSSTSNVLTGTIGQSTPLAGSFTTLTSTGVTTIGNNSATVAVNSSDWDISTTGDISGAGAITADGAIAFTPGSTSDITFTLDSDSTLILSGVQSGTATNGLCLDTDNNVITCSTSSSVTLQTAYGNDTDTGDTIIALTTADDSLIFRNPAASGTESSFLLKLDQLATGAVDGLNIAQAGTGTGITLSFSNSGTTADGILINNSAGTLTDAIDVSDATGFTNAINVGANKILGTTGAIDYTNFDVATSGLITVAAGTGLDTNAAGALNLGTTNATSAVIGSSALTSLTVTTDGTGNAEVALPTGSIGSGEILDNTIDWTDIIDSSTLDAATAIAFGGSTYTFTFTNNGSGNEIHNLTSSGDLVIQDNGSSMATFSDASVITLFPANGTASGGNVLIDGATTDSTLSSTSTGVFGITVDASISGASSTNYGFYIDYQTVDDSDASDTFNAARIDVTGSSVDNDAVYGLYINNVNDASGAATDSLLVLENNDANTAVTSGILFGAGGANSPDFTTGIDFSSATFTTELKFQNGETLDNATNSMFTFATNTSNADTIIVAPNVTASASTFAGTITSADLTAARTWTLPDATGTICVSGQACALTGTVTSSGSSISNRVAYFTTDSNITGSANFTFDPTVTTTDMVALTNNSQTAEDMLSLSNSSSSQSSNKFINITQTGVTTGYTGNLLSLSSTSTTGAATFLSVAANSSTVGTLAALSGTSLTSGTGLSITGGAANQSTTGELIDLVAGASTAGAGIRITSTGVYTGTAATDGLVNVVANSLTTGDGSKFSFTGLTSGTGVEIIGSGATMTTGGELLDLNLGATTVGAGVTITSTGTYTGTGSADGLINIVANSLTTGDGSKMSFTGLTSGTGLEIIGGTSMTTNGELLDLNMGAATAGNGINIATTGVYTGTGLSVLTANSATTGVLSQITGNGISTGKLLSLDSSSTAVTSGSLLSSSLTGASAFTGNLNYFDWSGASTTATGDVFEIHIGASSTTSGNIFNIMDDTSSIFAVSESQITSALPHQFTAAGDVAVAYDLQFTNQTTSFIKSNAPLTIEAGESFESNNLTLQTYNSGQVVVASMSGQLKMNVEGWIEANLNHSNSSTAAVCGTSSAQNAADSILDDCTTSVSADYAEVYPSESDVSYGDVVMAGPNSITVDHTSVDKNQEVVSAGQYSITKIAKSQSAYQSNVIGVVSNNWSDFSSTGAYAVPDDQNPLPVALSGRVPVKVADSSDPINPGDYITTSNVPGRAMKATNSGRVIGMALGSWNPGQGQETVLIFINNTWFDSGTQTAQNNSSGSADIASINGRLTTLENDFDTVVRASLTASNSGVMALFNDVKTNTLSVLGDTVLSDTVINGKLNVGTLTLDNTDQSINAVGTLKIQSLALGNIELQGGLVTIDTLGNVVVNTITAQKYKVAGASAGVSTIPGGTTEIFITTDQVSANSLIFVTPKRAISYPLSVTEKQDGLGFKVQVSQSDANDVDFDWFIVDKQ